MGHIGFVSSRELFEDASSCIDTRFAFLVKRYLDLDLVVKTRSPRAKKRCVCCIFPRKSIPYNSSTRPFNPSPLPLPLRPRGDSISWPTFRSLTRPSSDALTTSPIVRRLSLTSREMPSSEAPHSLASCSTDLRVTPARKRRIESRRHKKNAQKLMTVRYDGKFEFNRIQEASEERRVSEESNHNFTIIIRVSEKRQRRRQVVF